ncbi:nuclear transport factor 2 family protein [Sphingobium ummariense]|uniref:SnoaL-like domain-containing protein n=1 Tax=Sphingobium ummariense RL-3 TaxID=1346791 RepID=T0K1E4_9SPHN|nr:nuclear transport factor 2 family protein [Sphingobium ummariense]EQB30374.1 hypothetical protein M529_20135 [Sphingobium ummariense RL-3]
MLKTISAIARIAALSAVVGFVVLGAQKAGAIAGSEESRNRAAIARSFEAWRDGTGGPYDLLAEDALWTITGNSLAGKTYHNREAFMSEVIRPFNGRMAERLVPTVRRIYAEGDSVIVHFDARGVARDDKTYVNSYAWLLQLKDGRIVRAHAFFDAYAFDDLWRRVQPR